jgi:glycosyltransferase involved in cell wall biosynthesis
MRVLLVHTRYQSNAPSGEDIVFDDECQLLREHGHEVIVYERHNDDIKTFSPQQKVALLWQLTWSRKSYREIRYLIHREKPEVAHFHNTFPLISPSAYYACQDEGVPVVQTFHNFRFFCPSGLFYSNGHICEECLRYSAWRSIKYGCYRGSKVQTLPLAMMLWFHQRKNTWTQQIDIFIALTEFAREKYIQAGLPADRIVVKPNFMNYPPEPSYENQGYAIFLGRLSPEKGVKTLLTAWKKLTDVPLKILGDGVQRQELEEIARRERLSNVEFLGFLPHAEGVQLLQNARFMVMPSIWYESFPLTIREAFACGKPVVASRLGAMATIIEDGKTGLLFEPGNPDDLAAKVRWLVENEYAVIKIGKAARVEFEAKYTAERNYKMLMEIYEMAIRVRQERR